MGRCARRGSLAWFAATVALCASGVVSCGRIGFDEKFEQDASVPITVQPDATADLEASDDATRPGDDAAPGGDAASADDSPLDDAASACSPACVNPNGATACVNGSCAPVCSTGFADCDGNLSNGCETNVQADPAHCGSCTKACTVDSGSAICQSGTCGMSSCAAGTGDCDKDAGDGCETDLDTSATNCRFCGNACTLPNATSQCQGGTCKVATCAGGFGDCDLDPTNGCETPTNTTSNCGTCGYVCTSDAGSPACSGGACVTTCDLSGTWAGKVSLQVTWPGTVTLAGGSGTIGVWMIVKGTQSGSSIPVTMTPCGVVVPDFQSSAAAGNEPYGLTFPNTLFDHAPPYLLAVNSTVTLGATTVGSSYSIPAIAFLLGLSMTNPTTDAWPSTPEMVTQVDMDQDTNVGVTAEYKTGGTYVLVPLNLSKSVRSDKAYLAARFAASYAGTFSTCTNITGTATVTHYDTHVIGCEHSGGGACTQTESDFADSNKPAYVPGSATITMVKIANSGTCADVRGAI
jgi:hypothetical protein